MELLRPSSLEELDGGVLVHGGTEVVPLLREGLLQAERLVDIRDVVPRGVHDSVIGAGTTLEEGELLLEVELPPVEASTYLKAMDRKRWSFPQVGVAAARHADGSMRLALAGVAPIPWRIENVDELDGATPLPRTAWKVPLARTLVRRALAALD